MRLISQDGRVDFPYEQVGVTIDAADEKTIIAFPVNAADETYWNMAKYSTKKRASMAMKLLTYTYTRRKYVEDYFQLPSDNEIEEKYNMFLKKNIICFFK